MPVKRRNGGRNKKNKGHADAVHCVNCYRLVGKDKAIKRFVIKNMVDASSKRDIEANSAYAGSETPYSMPKIYVKNEWCIACGSHSRVVGIGVSHCTMMLSLLPMTAAFLLSSPSLSPFVIIIGI